MAYTKTAWVEGGAPAINAANLNNLEKQYDEALLWAKSFGLGDIAKDITDTDLNVLDATGFYKGQRLTNAPTTGFYFVINLKHTTTYRVQMIYSYGSGVTGSGKTFKRLQNVGVWSAWDEIETTAGAQTKIDGVTNIAQLLKITADNGGVTINLASGADLLASIMAKGVGLHSFYAPIGVTNIPNAAAAARGLAHITSTNNGWVYATDTLNNVYVNYNYGGVWTGWHQLSNIVSKGSNANGSYIKYSDGTMICWHIENYSVTYGPSWQSIQYGGFWFYYLGETWTYPATFLSGSTVSCNVSGDILATVQEHHTAYHFDHTKCTLEHGAYNYNVAGKGLKRQLFAIGRWK